MLAKASPIGNWLMSPLVIADAVVDTLLLLVLLRFGLRLGRSVAANSTRFPDVGKIISLATLAVILLIAYGQYETPTACLFFSPSDLSKAGQTLSSINLDQLAPGLAQMMQGIAKAEVNMATGATLVAFQKAAVVVLRQSPDIYGWTFLILIALPVVGIAVLISHNLDGFTEAVFHAASASSLISQSERASAGSAGALTDECGSCRQPMPAIAKFCQHCGAPFSAPTVISSARKLCQTPGGADNPATARF